MPEEGFIQAARFLSGRAALGRTGTHRTARQRRHGAGITITARDMAALRWMGEQFATRYDTLGVLLGRLSPSVTRRPGVLGAKTVAQVVERWSRAGLVTTYRLLGRQWAVPTRLALQLVGLDMPLWTPVVTQLAHVHAVALVRLAIEAELPDGHRWISERALRLESSALMADGAVELPEDEPHAPATASAWPGDEAEQLAPRIAVEVELTRKSAARMRAFLNRPRAARWERTVYYAPSHVASYLRGQIARVQPSHRFDVFGLPHVDGTTYGGAE